MVSDWLYMKYVNEKEDTYHKYILIDMSILDDLESEFYEKKVYLPFYICRFLKTDYYTSPLLDKYRDRVLSARQLNGELQVKELLDWLKEYPQYNSIFNEDAYKGLLEELGVIEKDYQEVKQIIG